jgi:hypothetical protein
MAGQITVSTIRNDTGVFATQNGMTGIPKAWVYFSGATNAIVNSFNISSVTYNSTGNFSLSFTTAMPNSNYVVTCGSDNDGNSRGCFGFLDNAGTAPTTSAFRVQFSTVAVNTFSTPGRAQIVVFGN